jgi:hypothetical protein
MLRFAPLPERLVELLDPRSGSFGLPVKLLEQRSQVQDRADLAVAQRRAGSIVFGVDSPG